MFDLDSFTEERIIKETEKILYLYTLKHVIRFGQTRSESDYTESVAEHIFGMHVLSDYFRPMEDPESQLDMQRVYQIITWHELDEIETGDIPSSFKTDTDRENAKKALETVLNKIPESLKSIATVYSDEYDNFSTPEAKYVKAIDKIEPLIHSFHPLGKGVQHELKLTKESSVKIKAKYLADFSYIKKFSDTLHEVMDRQGYFHSVD